MSFLKNIFYTSIILVIFALHPSLNKGDNFITSLQHYVYGNSLKLNINKSINKDLIQIKWACKTPNGTFKHLIIFENNKQLNEIPSEKGKQIILVYYNNKIIGELSQNKHTKNQANQYRIELISKGNSLFFKGEIAGPTPYQGKPIIIASL